MLDLTGAPDYVIELHEKAVEDAAAAGFEIVKGNANQLLLDLDTPAAVANYENRIVDLSGVGGFKLTEFNRWRSKSGIGIHVIVSVDKALEPVERLLLQAVLGSDPKRDMITLRRLRDGHPDPIRLFKPPASKQPGSDQ